MPSRRLVLIEPHGRWSPHGLFVAPTQLVGLASHASASTGIDTLVLDASALGVPVNERGERKLAARVVEFLSGRLERGSVVGFSMISDTSIFYSLYLGQAIRSAFDCTILAGGYAASSSFRLLLDTFSDIIDGVVVGPGEQACAEVSRQALAGRIDLSRVPGMAYRADGEVRLNPRRPDVPFDELAPLDFHTLAHPEVFRVAAYDTSRGCPWTCDFCPEAAMVQRHHVRSPVRIARDLGSMRDALPNCASVVLSDPLFGIPAPKYEEVCDELAHTGFSFAAETRADAFAPELYPRIRGTVSTLFFGLESASPDLLLRMNKTNNTDRYLASLLEHVGHCRDHDIVPTVGVMPNYPTTSRRDLEATESYVRQLRAAFALDPGRGLAFDGGFPYIVSHGRPHFEMLGELETHGATFEPAFPAVYHGRAVPTVRFNTKDASHEVRFDDARDSMQRISANCVTVGERTLSALQDVRWIELAPLGDSDDVPDAFFIDSDHDLIDYYRIATDIAGLSRAHPSLELTNTLGSFATSEGYLS